MINVLKINCSLLPSVIFVGGTEGHVNQMVREFPDRSADVVCRCGSLVCYT